MRDGTRRFRPNRSLTVAALLAKTSPTPRDYTRLRLKTTEPDAESHLIPAHVCCEAGLARMRARFETEPSVPSVLVCWVGVPPLLSSDLSGSRPGRLSFALLKSPDVRREHAFENSTHHFRCAGALADTQPHSRIENTRSAIRDYPSFYMMRRRRA